MKVFETKDYYVKVTTNKLRMQEQQDLPAYCIINSTLGVVEATASNLPLAISTCVAVQEALNDAYKTNMPKSAKVVSLHEPSV